MSLCFWLELCEHKTAGRIRSNAARNDTMEGFPLMCRLLTINMPNPRQFHSLSSGPTNLKWHREQCRRFILQEAGLGQEMGPPFRNSDRLALLSKYFLDALSLSNNWGKPQSRNQTHRSRLEG